MEEAQGIAPSRAHVPPRSDAAELAPLVSGQRVQLRGCWDSGFHPDARFLLLVHRLILSLRWIFPTSPAPQTPELQAPT